MWKRVKGAFILSTAALIITLSLTTPLSLSGKVKGPRLGSTLVVAYWGDPKSFP